MQPLILPYRGEYNIAGVRPAIAADAYVAPGAAVIGDVEIGAESGIWFGCVVRGDVNTVRIGARTNIQDGTMIHVTRRTGPTVIGANVTIGHAALLHACTLQDGCFIGMRATVMDDVVVETGGWVAAGALVTPGKRIPSGQIWAGSPAKYFRDLTQDEIAHIPVSAQNYVDLAREHKALSS
jgi:carbonic anhydrase/acetyltransferase-like protein (isoleucine patch superfamily)